MHLFHFSAAEKDFSSSFSFLSSPQIWGNPPIGPHKLLEFGEPIGALPWTWARKGGARIWGLAEWYQQMALTEDVWKVISPVVIIRDFTNIAIWCCYIWKTNTFSIQLTNINIKNIKNTNRNNKNDRTNSRGTLQHFNLWIKEWMIIYWRWWSSSLKSLIRNHRLNPQLFRKWPKPNCACVPILSLVWGRGVLLVLLVQEW